MNYIGIYSNGTTIVRQFLSDFVHLEDIRFILSRKLHNEWTAIKNTYYNYQYILINVDGGRRDFRIGAFQLYDIAPEDNGFNRCNISYEIKNLNTGEIHSFTAYQADTYNFFIDKIVSKMEQLNHFGSNEALENSYKLSAYETEIDQLREKINGLESEITILKNNG